MLRDYKIKSARCDHSLDDDDMTVFIKYFFGCVLKYWIITLRHAGYMGDSGTI